MKCFIVFLASLSVVQVPTIIIAIHYITFTTLDCSQNYTLSLSRLSVVSLKSKSFSFLADVNIMMTQKCVSSRR